MAFCYALCGLVPGKVSYEKGLFCRPDVAAAAGGTTNGERAKAYSQRDFEFFERHARGQGQIRAIQPR